MALRDVEGREGVIGASASIEIVRDRHAVPHIYAQSSDDALFSLGYVHGQDQDRASRSEPAGRRRSGAVRLRQCRSARSLLPDGVATEVLLRCQSVVRAAAQGEIVSGWGTASLPPRALF